MPFVLSQTPPRLEREAVDVIADTYNANGFLLQEQLDELLKDPETSIHCLLVRLSDAEGRMKVQKVLMEEDRKILGEYRREVSTQASRADLAVSMISDVQQMKERIDTMLYPLRQLARMGRHTTHVCEANLHLLAAGIADYIEGNE